MQKSDEQRVKPFARRFAIDDINLIEKHTDYNDKIANCINNKLKDLKNEHLKIELP